MMKTRGIAALGAVIFLAALATVAVIALPASGTAPAGSSFFAKLDGEHDVPAGDPDGYGTFSASFNGTKLCYGLQVAKTAAFGLLSEYLIWRRAQDLQPA